MKHKIIKNYLFIAALCLLYACSHDFLNTDPATEFSEQALWSDQSLVETFINNLYDRLDEPLTDGRMKAMLVDEAHYRSNQASTDFNNGLITQDRLPAWGSVSYLYTWNDLYKSIRYCNIFFENVEKVPFSENLVDGKSLRDRMTGEVHFLRAYNYFNLSKIYGGVPIIKQVYALDDDFQVARNSFEETIDFILEDINRAIELLPLEHSGANRGRITKGAAMALKSRVTLYAASDLYNQTIFPDYEDQELIRYTNDNRQQRWTAARDAAKAVIDLNQYTLYQAQPSSATEAAENYFNLFVAKDTEEDIFVKYFTVTVQQRWGLYTSPNGYHGWGANAPLGDLVDDYEMVDGSPFSWNNPEHAADPYRNRDPRFHGTILHNGAEWRVRPDDAKGLDPENRIQTGRKEVWNPATGEVELHYGVDTRNSTIEDWNGSQTGYYTKKYLDPNNDAQYVRQSVTWRFIRYTEILLNYAEACIELGQEEEAIKYINMVRTRAGMPAINDTGAALKERYRNERRIELAFEDHRFFDVRRWAIGEEAYQSAHAANVVYKLNDDKTTSSTPTISHVVFEERKWDDKMYFFPIMRDEINKNELLVQNPKY